MKQLSSSFSILCLALLSTTSALAGGDHGLAVGTAEANEGDVTSVDLRMSSTGAVQGLVMVFEWDGRKAEGVSLTASGPIETADLIVTRVEADFMVLSAVIDDDGEGPGSIPAGVDQTIGSATLRCICPGFRQEIAIALVDGRHARVDSGPLLDNLLVVGGASITQVEGLVLGNGELVCNPDAQGPPFLCGGPMDENGAISAVEGRPGETVTLCYYYRDPAPTGGRIQGLSMALSYDCNLSCIGDSVSITGGAIDAANAEFFNLHCDNDASDGDGCEMVVGMLIDLDADHDGRRLPAADDSSLLFCVDYTISEDAVDGSCLGVSFENGVNGRGQVDTDNLVSIDFFESPAQTVSCEICVEADLLFIRGDCNFNEAVNIADAAAMVGVMFLAEFPAQCFDACDADDNGAHNVSDPVYLLNYLFVPGNPAPSAPFPSPGEDPTDDALDCSGEAAFP